MIREIITYPNKLLLEKSEDIVSFDESLHTLLDDMYETMIHLNGVGLAGIQIGVKSNLLIINLPDEEGNQHKEDLIEVINPKIVDYSGEQFREEGCLSVPGFEAIIKRYENITVEYFDRYANKIIKDYQGYLSVAWQHEMDHLNGSLFVQKLSIIDNKKFKKHVKKK
jgi:peptide deformylase